MGLACGGAIDGCGGAGCGCGAAGGRDCGAIFGTSIVVLTNRPPRASSCARAAFAKSMPAPALVSVAMMQAAMLVRSIMRSSRDVAVLPRI
jgi:hypothetical protein